MLFGVEVIIGRPLQWTGVLAVRVTEGQESWSRCILFHGTDIWTSIDETKFGVGEV